MKIGPMLFAKSKLKCNRGQRNCIGWNENTGGCMQTIMLNSIQEKSYSNVRTKKTDYTSLGLSSLVTPRQKKRAHTPHTHAPAHTFQRASKLRTQIGTRDFGLVALTCTPFVY